MQRAYGEKIISNDEFNWACDVYAQEKDLNLKSADYNRAVEILTELDYFPDQETDDIQ